MANVPEPELLVLDEPTSGLDPLVRCEFIQTVFGAYQEADPGRHWRIRTLRLQSPLLCSSVRRHTTTKLGRITKARANVSPSPEGEGWGEGEQDTRSLGHLRFGLGPGKRLEGPHGSEPFIISSLRLYRRSSTRTLSKTGAVGAAAT